MGDADDDGVAGIDSGQTDVDNDGIDDAEVLTLSIEIENYNEFISLYPNPVLNNILNIRFGSSTSKASITMYDMSGRLISTWTPSIVNDRLEINVSKVNSGSYFLLIKTDTGAFTKQVIVGN